MRAVIVLLCTLLVLACGGGTLDTASAPVTLPVVPVVYDEAHISRGAATFDTNCRVCHAAPGNPSIGPDLTDGVWIHGDRPVDIERVIRSGVLEKGCPSWEQMLSDEQIAELVAYVVTNGSVERAPGP